MFCALLFAPSQLKKSLPFSPISLTLELLFSPFTYFMTNSNGLAPDNLFFHGVACNCVQIQLSHLGFDTEFAQCEIQVDEKEWEGVRRKYWHSRETYYLPIVTWKKENDAS